MIKQVEIIYVLIKLDMSSIRAQYEEKFEDLCTADSGTTHTIL